MEFGVESPSINDIYNVHTHHIHRGISDETKELETINETNTNVTFLGESEYECYQSHESKSSLTKAFLSWIVITLFIVTLCLIPLCIFAICCTILLIPLSFYIWKKYIVYILSVTILPLLYVLYILDLHKIRIFAFYSVFPVVISVIFRDSIIFGLQIRENIRLIFTEKTFLEKNRITRFNYKVLNKLQLEALLKYFVKHYHIWGRTLNEYKPFGSVKLRGSAQTKINTLGIKTSSINTSSLPFKQRAASMQDLIDEFLETFNNADKWSLNASFRVYDTTEKVMAIFMLIFAVIYILLPSLYYVFELNENTNYSLVSYIVIDIIQFVFGIILNCIIVYSIAHYTELIFYRLYKYYKYMKYFADLVDIKASRTYESHFNLNTSPREKAKTTNTERDTQNPYIWLFDDDNYHIWFENWSRIEILASIYFENKKSWVFGVICCIAMAIAIILYNILILNDWFNSHLMVIWCGLLYFISVFIRLLLCSIRFSRLQHRHIALLQNQHTLLIHHMIHMGQQKENQHSVLIQNLRHIPPQKENNNSMMRFRWILYYINDIIMQIKFRSLNPKIAGVSLDVALVRLSVSIFFGLLTSIFTYYLRSSTK